METPNRQSPAPGGSVCCGVGEGTISGTGGGRAGGGNKAEAAGGGETGTTTTAAAGAGNVAPAAASFVVPCKVGIILSMEGPGVLAAAAVVAAGTAPAATGVAAATAAAGVGTAVGTGGRSVVAPVDGSMNFGLTVGSVTLPTTAAAGVTCASRRRSACAAPAGVWDQVSGMRMGRGQAREGGRGGGMIR